MKIKKKIMPLLVLKLMLRCQQRHQSVFMGIVLSNKCIMQEKAIYIRVQGKLKSNEKASLIYLLKLTSCKTLERLCEIHN